MTNMKKNLDKMVTLGLLTTLTACNAPSGSSSGTGPTFAMPPEMAPETYEGHYVFVATPGNIWTMQPDSRTGELKVLYGGLTNSNGTVTSDVSLVMSPNKNYLFATVGAKGTFKQYGMPNANGLLPLPTSLNPASISTNYDADALAFDTSSNLYVHYTKSITPFDEKVAKMAFNETDNTLTFAGYVTTGIPSLAYNQSVDLLDLSYVLNPNLIRVDMYQDATLTSYSTYMSYAATSIAIK